MAARQLVAVGLAASLLVGVTIAMVDQGVEPGVHGAPPPSHPAGTPPPRRHFRAGAITAATRAAVLVAICSCYCFRSGAPEEPPPPICRARADIIVEMAPIRVRSFGVTQPTIYET
jgi:hypothetical protein